ncbi:MAG: endonuclease/exonuclease/phosphatase family protein [Chloroflexi bacterium]|nr:endonuclease/exonuclease/phosphatase family protein [Chloroflexota bacterium]
MKQSLRGLTAWLLCSSILIAPVGVMTPKAFSQDTPLLKIGEVQGAVTNDESDPQTFGSPHKNERVQVQGVVTNLMMIDTSGRQLNLFFLQETPENSDGDSNTSDAIQVLIGAKTAFDDYTPVLGDIITVEGKVEEFYDMTRLREIKLVSVDGQVEDLEAAVPSVEFNPTGETLAIDQMSERLESMRVFVPEMSYTISATHLYASSDDSEVYVMRGDVPVAQRENLYERRVWRDTEALDDGLAGDNPYRISVEANVLKGLAYDYNVNLPAYSTYETFTTPLTGNLVYAFARYTLQIDTLPEVQAGVAPDQNTPIVAADPASQFTIATFNVENLYDFYNDPFDINDNPENLAFNYVPRTLEAYQTHITKLAHQIVEALHSPDILGLQEIEDQDVCVGGLIYGTCSNEVDNANGLPDALEDLSIEIAHLTNSAIIYMPAIDRDSADTRGITQAFLYRTDRVAMPIAPEDPILGPRPDDPNADKFPMNQEISNPKSLSKMFAIGTPQYDRAPLVGLFHIFPAGMTAPDSPYIEVYIADNHFISNPDASNVLREGQASYNIELAQSVLAANPDAYYIVAGDLNNYPYSSEVSLFEPVFNNLWDEIPAVSRYTYVYQGQTQTLDQILVSPALTELLASVGVAHVNSDYPYQLMEDATSLYHSTDHDPVVATFNFPAE